MIKVKKAFYGQRFMRNQVTGKQERFHLGKSTREDEIHDYISKTGDIVPFEVDKDDKLSLKEVAEASKLNAKRVNKKKFVVGKMIGEVAAKKAPKPKKKKEE